MNQTFHHETKKTIQHNAAKGNFTQKKYIANTVAGNKLKTISSY